MRKQIINTLLLGLLFAGLASNAQQQQHFPDLHPDSVMRQDPRSSQMMFEPGEIIVRFHDELIVNLVKSNGKTMTGISAIDELFNEWGITDVEPLIKGAEVLKTKQMLTTFNGKEFERPSLHNIYKLKTSVETHQFFEAIKALSENKQILYAEPNFIVAVSEEEPISPPLNEQELLAWLNENDIVDPPTKNTAAVVPNDPLYSQQWGIPATQIDQVWETTTGTPDQIIAILDTGVDWNHPDLAENIWNNSDESVNGTDSDGNGFVDDVRGWDFINNDNNPLDDNSHGTHVAGIAAAKGNNGIGIAGVNWAAKIMPIKVFQSSGQGNMATIVQGINYAAQNGATVINMSFGTYARSFALEDALANAYSTAVLVAAAGNDGLCIGPELCQDMRPGMPSYPGGLSFVLGITAHPASFTNYDQDGPVYSDYDELYNYELSAPGTTIISTIPNGGYRVYNGTSMASPLVAGAVAFYRSIKPQQSQEIMWGNLINTVDGYLKIKDALEVVPQPKLWIVSKTIVDTLVGDGDGRPDAGETIQLWIKVRNTWGSADNVQAKLRLGEFEDPTVATITNSTATIGSISAYASKSNENTPFVVQFSSDIVHGRDIVFEALSWNAGSTDTIHQEFVLTITNAVKVNGLINGNVTWFPGINYYVNDNLRISENGVLTIMPGTNVRIGESKVIDVRGVLIANGNIESKIKFSGMSNNNSYWFSGISVSENGQATYNYCLFEFLNGVQKNTTYTGKCEVSNSVLSNNMGSGNFHGINIFENNSIVNNLNFRFTFFYVQEFNNNLIANNFREYDTFLDIFFNPNTPIVISDNSLYGNFNNNLNQNLVIRGNISFANIQGNYWGTSDSLKIQKSIYDFYFDYSLPIAIFSPYNTIPSEETHGHVWKILVNGADAQDEFVEPVGVGLQRFDVYFNRPMDPNCPPLVSFGVRAPYTQQAVAENGSWSADHKIYTVYKTVQLYTGDGINRIRVSGARDLEGFEIPYEDSRFEFLINAAGSASTDFTATSGIGKVNLEWTYPDDLPTLLGFNIYRFHQLTDTTFGDTTLVNTILINDTLFTDFNVVPQKRYYYMYKIVRTDFTESDYSKVVNAIVLTASPGDANGDMTVNVLDITTIVSYMMNQNPQPFINEAADINADGAINVLDIIGVVNVIMGNTKMMKISQPGHIYLKEDKIDFKSDGSFAGLQFQLIGKNIDQLELSKVADGFEYIKTIHGDTLTGVIFNMQNNTLPEGSITLFEIKKHPGTLNLGEVFGGNYDGRYVAVYKDQDALPVDFRYQFIAYPNPVIEQIQLDFRLPTAAEVSIQSYDYFGRSVPLLKKEIFNVGVFSKIYSPHQLGLSKGLYILQINVQPLDKSELPFKKEVKIIIM